MNSNVLSQYNHYLSHNIIPLNLYLTKIEQCEKLGRVNQIDRCVPGLLDGIDTVGFLNSNKSRWFDVERNVNESCRYKIIHNKIDSNNSIYPTDLVNFTITTYDCEKQLNSMIKGGSSFEVLIFGSFLSQCRVNDNFEWNYTVSCEYPDLFSSDQLLRPIPLNGGETNDNEIIIKLDYENYDAFFEIGVFKWRTFQLPLRLEIQRLPFLLPIIKLKNAVIHGNNSQLLSSGLWIADNYLDRNVSIIHSEIFVPDVVAAPNQTQSQMHMLLNQYVWYWRFNAHSHSEYLPRENNGQKHLYDNLHKQIFVHCLEHNPQNRKIILVGSSHMRYNWDAMVAIIQHQINHIIVNNASSHENSLEVLDRKHGDANWRDVHYHEVLFVKKLIDYLDEVCDDVVLSNFREIFYLVIQAGAWDLSYWPLRYLVEKSGPKLLNMLQFLIERKCSSNIHLIWLTEVPYPDCTVNMENSQTHMEGCQKNKQGRNNYVISGWNDYLVNGLQESKYPNLQIIDAYSMIHPRLFRGEYVCGNHYLCKDFYSKKLLTTPAGLIVIEGIFRSLCHGIISR